MIAIATSERYREAAPSHIVPILAEEGVYVASESSFCRAMRQEKLLRHREASRPRKHSRDEEHIAKGPDEVLNFSSVRLDGLCLMRYALVPDKVQFALTAQRSFENPNNR
jgi:hypothetical protein